MGCSLAKTIDSSPKILSKKISASGQAGRAELTPASFYGSGAKPPTTLPSKGQGPARVAAVHAKPGVWGPRLLTSNHA